MKDKEEAERKEAIEKFTKSINDTKLEANPNCKKCYGRGFMGRDINTNLMKICRCLKRRKEK